MDGDCRIGWAEVDPLTKHWILWRKNALPTVDCMVDRGSDFTHYANALRKFEGEYFAKKNAPPVDPAPLQADAPKTIAQIQSEHAEWLVRNFGVGNEVADLEQFLGITEEVGELAHALLKGRQGIRGDAAKHEAGARDAVGDIFIFLSGFCVRKGWNLEQIINETWAEVSKRDWTKKENA
jgi:NTP pyrophosphatase (non-canonical NTP hydrolase)